MKVWIDIDNSPHVPLFEPLIHALHERGDEVLVTSREYAQTRSLLRKTLIPFAEIGSHAGSNSFAKIVSLVTRTWRLILAVREFSPDVAVSHGSRALALASKCLGIPSLLLFDYEWTEFRIFKWCSTLMACPRILSDSILSKAKLPLRRIRRYDGLKEEVYLPFFAPDPTFRSSLHIPDEACFVVIRPSAMTSNYHDPKSEQLLALLLKRVAREKNVIALVTPRTEADRVFVMNQIESLDCSNIRIASKTYDGLQLLYWADVVVSGGGTMNRESALLGTPTLSIFSGKKPGVDAHLETEGKLNFIEDEFDIERIEFVQKVRSSNFQYTDKGLIERCIQLMEETLGNTYFNPDRQVLRRENAGMISAQTKTSVHVPLRQH